MIDCLQVRGEPEATMLHEATLERFADPRNIAKGNYRYWPLHVYRKAWEEEKQECVEALDRIYHASTVEDQIAALEHFEREVGDRGAYMAAAIGEARRWREQKKGESEV